MHSKSVICKKILFFTAVFVFFVCCTRQKLNIKKSLEPTTDKLNFASGGPYDYTEFEDFSIALNPKESVEANLFLCKKCKDSPLVILLHGNSYTRLAHRFQAQKLASWGINTLLVDLPNRKQWNRNAHRLQKIVKLIKGFPEIISKNLNPHKIILAGHSFGGYSVSLAASKLQEKIAGIILLDPAVFNSKRLKDALKKIEVPSIILASDPLIFKAKKSYYFFKYAKHDTLEISVTGTDHLNAQWPSIHEVLWGFDFRDQKYHKRYLETFLLSAINLSKDKDIGESWNSFSKLLELGLIKNSKMKFVSEK